MTVSEGGSIIESGILCKQWHKKWELWMNVTSRMVSKSCTAHPKTSQSALLGINIINIYFYFLFLLLILLLLLLLLLSLLCQFCFFINIIKQVHVHGLMSMGQRNHQDSRRISYPWHSKNLMEALTMSFSEIDRARVKATLIGSLIWGMLIVHVT